MATAEDIKFRFTVQDDLSKQLKSINTEFQTLSVRSEVAAKSLLKTETGFSRISSQAAKVRTSMKGANHSIQQASYQIQDIAVQAEMGVDPLRILGQQGSQLAMALGPQGALIGGIIAVGAALVGTMIPAADNTSEALQEMFEELEKGTESLTKFNAEQARLAKVLLPDQIQKALQAVMEKRQAEEDEIKTLEALRKAEFVSPATIKAQERAVELAKIQNQAAQERLDLLKNTSQEIRNAKEGQGLDFSDADYEAAAEREIAAVEKKNQELMAIGERFTAYNNKLREEDLQFHQDWLKDQWGLELEAEEARQDALKDLRKLGLLDNEYNIRNSLVKQLDMVKKYESEGLITTQQAEQAKAQIRQRATQGAMAELSQGITALGQYNKKAFAISKAIRTGEAIMNTYAGATQALATYPPPFSYIAAAGQIAFGMAQVAQIKSQSFSGRAVGGRVEGGTPYMVGEQGREMFIPSTRGQIVKNSDVEKMGGSGGAVNVNFTINAVDTRGFAELLNSRRGQIVNMVNQAMNDRGRAGVTA